MQLTHPYFVDGRLWGFAEKKPDVDNEKVMAHDAYHDSWHEDTHPLIIEWLQSKDAIIAEPEFKEGESVYFMDGDGKQHFITLDYFMWQHHLWTVKGHTSIFEVAESRLSHYKQGQPYPMEYIKDGEKIEVPKETIKEEGVFYDSEEGLPYEAIRYNPNPAYTQFLQEKKDGLIQIRITNQ